MPDRIAQVRAWLATTTGRLIAIGGLTLVAVVTVGVLIAVPMLAGSFTSASTDEPSRSPSPAPTASVSPSPTPSASASAVAEEAPAEQTPAAPAAPKPAAPPAGEPPGIIGMNPAPFQYCPENPAGETVYAGLSWDAREGNTVDVYYAYTDGDYLATSGFALYGSGLPSSGSVQIPKTCPIGTEGSMSRVTIKLVANNAVGSSTANYWGL